MTSDEENDFVVMDSDEEINSDEEYESFDSKKNDKRSNAYTIMESDVDSPLSDEDSAGHSPDKSIYKAIRRSIMNISRKASKNDDDDEDIELSSQNNDSDSDGKVSKKIRHKKTHIMSDNSTDDDTSEDEESKVMKKHQPSYSRIKKVDSSSDSDVKPSHNEYRRKKFDAIIDDSSDDDDDNDDDNAETMSKTASNISNMSISIIEPDNNSIDGSTKKDNDNNSSIINETIDLSNNNDMNNFSQIDDDPVDCFQSKLGRNLDDVRRTLSPLLDIVHDDEIHSKRSVDKSILSTKSTVIDEISSSDEVNKNNNHAQNKIIDIDSDSSDDNLLMSSTKISDDEDNNVSITVLTENKFVNTTDTNSSTIQKHQRIDDRIKEINYEIAKSQQFLASSYVNKLPDGGKKMRDNIKILDIELKKLKNESKNIDFIKTVNSSTDEKSRFFSTSSPLNKFDNKQKSKSMNNNFDTKKLNKEPQLPNKYNYGVDLNDSSMGESSSDDDKENAVNELFFQSPKAGFDINKLGTIAKATFERENQLTVDTLKNFHGSLASCPTEDILHRDPRGLKIKLMPHQRHALAWLLWREQQKPPGGVLADDMGLGKTLTMISLVMESNELDSDDGKSSDDDDWVGSARRLKYSGNTLVVCPASLINQWAQEIQDRTKSGTLSVELHHGTNRETSTPRLAKKDIVLTTYAILSRAHKNNTGLFKIQWKRVILDEAHVVRNHKSQCSEAVCGLVAEKRWAMTGTPIHNKEMDLFALLKFLRVEPFDDIRVWKRWVDNKDSAGHTRLATVMKTLMLRRTKEELTLKGALEALPQKKIDVIWVDMDPEEKIIYQKVMLYSKTLFAQFLSQRAQKQDENMFVVGSQKYDNPTQNFDPLNAQFNKAQKALLAAHAEVKSHEILVLLLRLRQVCCHLSLIHDMLDQEDLEQSGIGDSHGIDVDLLMKMTNMKLDKSLISHGSNHTGDDDNDDDNDEAGVDEQVKNNLLTSENPVFERTRQSSKLRAVLNLVREILAKDEKVIIVSQWSTVLDIVAENLNEIKRATYKKFTGKIPVKDRQDIVNAFNQNSNPKILLLSLTAGGVGLNLVGGNNLILMDIHWNPQLESQAQDRIYRFGQRKDVTIYKVLITDSIEERIKALQDRKLEIASSVLTGTGKVTSSKLSLDDLKSLFGFR